MRYCLVKENKDGIKVTWVSDNFYETNRYYFKTSDSVFNIDNLNDLGFCFNRKDGIYLFDIIKFYKKNGTPPATSLAERLLSYTRNEKLDILGIE